MIESIWKSWQDATEEMEDSKVKIKFKDILWNYGISSDTFIKPIQLVDIRTRKIIENYEYAKLVHKEIYNNQVWFDAVSILLQIDSSKSNMLRLFNV